MYGIELWCLVSIKTRLCLTKWSSCSSSLSIEVLNRTLRCLPPAGVRLCVLKLIQPCFCYRPIHDQSWVQPLLSLRTIEPFAHRPQTKYMTVAIILIAHLNVDLSGHILITHRICITAQWLLIAHTLVNIHTTSPDSQTPQTIHRVI